jgi:hypothetical protein
MRYKVRGKRYEVCDEFPKPRTGDMTDEIYARQSNSPFRVDKTAHTL